MKFIKTFDSYDAKLDLNYILEDEVYSHYDAIELLDKVNYAIENNCVIDNINTHWMNRTPLIVCAISECHIKTTSKYRNVYKRITKELLDAGANIDHVDKDNRSALIWAASRKHFDIVKLLIEKGANWNIIDVYHKEFHNYLTEQEYIEIINEYPEQYELYKMKNSTKKFNI